MIFNGAMGRFSSKDEKINTDGYPIQSSVQYTVVVSRYSVLRKLH